MPGVDTNSFVDARRKDVEALVAANKIAYEALQALASTQADTLTQARPCKACMSRPRVP
jgi:hypothetical protein